jgi:hypothetical protein
MLLKKLTTWSNRSDDLSPQRWGHFFEGCAMNYLEETVRGLQQDNRQLRREVKSANNRAIAMSAIALVAWVIATLLASQPVQAAEGRNWCADFVDGYVVGVCWGVDQCDLDALAPVMCPYPKAGETDGYIVGLRDGLAAGRVEL